MMIYIILSTVCDAVGRWILRYIAELKVRTKEKHILLSHHITITIPKIAEFDKNIKDVDFVHLGLFD